MVKRFGLGRGLSSLIPERDKQSEEASEDAGMSEAYPTPAAPAAAAGLNHQSVGPQKIAYISPKDIITSHFQPRKFFEHSALEELVNSIKQYGVLEPLIVSPLGEGQYKLVAGERRLRAAKILNLQTVPVIMRSVSEQERLEISLIENIQRRDLNPIEEATTYEKLIDEFHLTQDEVAKKVGKSRSQIANACRLLTLPQEIQALIAGGKISVGHAKVILELKTPAEQLQMVKRALGQNLSVREIERKVKVKTAREVPPISQKIKQVEISLSEYLKTKVNIKPKRQGGVVEIEYYSDEELASIVERLAE